MLALTRKKGESLIVNNNIEIMDRKVLKDKIDELRSAAKMELACTIREIMREHNVKKKELGWPVVVNTSSLVDIVEVGSCDTDIPVFTISVGAGYYKEPHKVGALDDSVSVELLADIATGLNNELSGYVSTYVAKYRFLYESGTARPARLTPNPSAPGELNASVAGEL